MSEPIQCGECDSYLHLGDYYVTLVYPEGRTVCLECASHMGWVAHGQKVWVAGYTAEEMGR